MKTLAVSDHACKRYMERVLGGIRHDMIEQIRTLLHDILCYGEISVLGAGRYPVDDEHYAVVIEDKKSLDTEYLVVTVRRK